MWRLPWLSSSEEGVPVSHTNSALSHNGRVDTSDSATKNGLLRLAMSEMATGIKIPKSVAWRLYDSKRGRIAHPLGSYPEVAEACIDAGGNFHHITRPLSVMAAHIRRRMSNKLPGDMKSALLSVKKECDEAEAMALTLAFSGNVPDASALVTSIKEDSDAILALEKAKEIAEDRLAELEAK